MGNKTTPSPSWKLGFHSLDPNLSMNTCVSARKIGANLWDQMNDGRRRQRSYEKDQLGDSQPIQPEKETSLRRNIAELRHLSVDKNRHLSSASCCSSMQVTPYASGYTFKTSTHLLQLLNRIWILEEQHSRNTFLIKSLKRDLEISQAQIKTLVEERKLDHQEIDELIRSRKQKDELLEIKSLFKREKKARILLESLCDEFAKGIRDYEQKVRFLQQNRGIKDQTDRLILHVSEAWLDERSQMKSDFSEKTSISDNLCCEIEMFLEAKKKQSCGFEVENDDILEEHGSCSPLMIERDQKPMIDPGVGVTEPSSCEGVRANTLMAKLVEARLESQFSKSTTVKKVV